MADFIFGAIGVLLVCAVLYCGACLLVEYAGE